MFQAADLISVIDNLDEYTLFIPPNQSLPLHAVSYRVFGNFAR